MKRKDNLYWTKFAVSGLMSGIINSRLTKLFSLLYFSLSLLSISTQFSTTAVVVISWIPFFLIFWSLFGVTLIIVAEMRDHGKSNPCLCCMRFNKALNYVDNIDGLIGRLPQFRILWVKALCCNYPEISEPTLILETGLSNRRPPHYVMLKKSIDLNWLVICDRLNPRLFLQLDTQ